MDFSTAHNYKDAFNIGLKFGDFKVEIINEIALIERILPHDGAKKQMLWS